MCVRIVGPQVRLPLSMHSTVLTALPLGGLMIWMAIIWTMDFLAYLCYKGYRFVLGGFYPEEDMFNRDVDSYSTKKD